MSQVHASHATYMSHSAHPMQHAYHMPKIPYIIQFTSSLPSMLDAPHPMQPHATCLTSNLSPMSYAMATKSNCMQSDPDRLYLLVSGSGV